MEEQWDREHPQAAESERIANLEAELAEKQRVLDLLLNPHAVHTNILRGFLPLTKAQAIHIAHLPANVEEKLAALDWTPISPENPVQTGDEVLTRERSSVFVPEAGHLKGCPTEEWLALGYTHRRPLNAPEEASER